MIPVLSILVITHNQRLLLQRCLKSVFAQRLFVPFEVIISDDRSTDGTDEYVKEVRAQMEGRIENLTTIKYVHCNSDECAPLMVSDRCGWNKLTAYLHSEGKYFVNIDADDFLRSSDIYQLQIDALESFPACSMCMQRALSVHDGEDVSNGHAWPQSPLLQDSCVIDEESFIRNDLRGLNQTYMIRRHPDDDMMGLYGKWFDDTVITYHHLQYGPVVFIDRADYVWVQYDSSISHNMSKDDIAVVYGLLPLFHAEVIPSLRMQFIKSGIPTLNRLLKSAPEFPNLSEQYRAHLSQFNGFVYRYYLASKHRVYDKLRFMISRILLRLANRFNWESPFICNLIVRVLI